MFTTSSRVALSHPPRRRFHLGVAPRGVRVNCVAVGPLEETSLSDLAATVSFLVNDGDFFVGQVLCPAAGSAV